MDIDNMKDPIRPKGSEDKKLAIFSFREKLMDRLSPRGENGFALVLSLVTMAGMAVLSIAIFTTSTTDMYIARNEKEARMAFYLAEAGIDEALGRLDLGGGNPRFVGENSAQKIARRGESTPVTKNKAETAGGFPEAGQSFNSGFMNYTLGADLFGSYSVVLSYADEAADAWECALVNGVLRNCTLGDDDEIVMFGQNFGFTGDGIPEEGINPIYQIDSTGTTTNGTSSKVRVYVTSSALNVLPPGDTIMWAEEQIYIQAGKTIDGKVASVLDAVFGCGTAPCENVTNTTAAASVTSWNTDDMNDYLGLSLDSLKSYADVYEFHDGGGTLQLTPGDGLAGSEWGELCNTDTANNEDLHVCENEAKLVYIDNAGAGVGDAKLNAGHKGRGILIVTGNLEVAGSVVWEGMIYVMGTLKVTGDVTIFGTLMIDGDDDGIANQDVYVNGNLKIFGSQKVAMSAGDMVGVPKMVRWLRL